MVSFFVHKVVWFLITHRNYNPVPNAENPPIMTQNVVERWSRQYEKVTAVHRSLSSSAPASTRNRASPSLLSRDIDRSKDILKPDNK